MPSRAQPIINFLRYFDPSSGKPTQEGHKALTQQVNAINSIPISVSGENVNGAGTNWTLANVPANGLMLFGQSSGGLVPLAPGKGNTWNYSINGAQITTATAFQAVIGSYEYLQP